MTVGGIDPDLRNELKRSKKAIGEIYPIVRNQRGEILIGNTRHAAGWKSETKINTRDKLHDLQIVQAGMIQHRNTEEEHINILTRMCEEIEKTKKIPREKIGRYVVNNVSSLQRAYAYELIPERYKRPYFSSSSLSSSSSSSSSSSQSPAVDNKQSSPDSSSSFWMWTINGVTFVRKTLEEMSEASRTTMEQEATKRERSCPWCGKSLLISQDYMVLKN
jgi:hypothetical protein